MTDEEQTVFDAVHKHIQNKRPGGATIEVLQQGIRHEQDWWYVSVRPSVQPKRRFEYYKMLAEVENELITKEHLTVLLVPG